MNLKDLQANRIIKDRLLERNMEKRPQILVNIAHLGPVYVTLEITNVGTLAGQDVEFSYTTQEASDVKRTFYQPLLKINESKIIYLQNAEGTLIGQSEYLKENKTVIQTQIKFTNVLTGENYCSEQKLDLSKYIKQSDNISVQWKEEEDHSRNNQLEKLSRSIDSMQRNIQKIEQETHNQLNVNRLMIQKQMLFDYLEHKIKTKKSLQEIQQKVNELFIILMDPYPDMKNKEIQKILDNIKKHGKITYDSVWCYFPSLKWSKVKK